MWNRGKLVIVAILLVGLFAAGFSAWYRYRGQHRALDFWGTTSAVLIVEAPNVELLELGAPGPAVDNDEGEGETADEVRPRAVEHGDYSWPVTAARDGQAARGIKNIRPALLLDNTFEWSAEPGDDEPNWQYALGFNDRRNWATVLFDFQSGRVALTGGRKSAQLHPEASSELRKFFVENFPDEPSSDATQAPDAEAPSGATDEPAAAPPPESANPPAAVPGGAQANPT